MGWFDYYNLLKKYDGDLKKATKKELDYCARGNPNDPESARALAEREWKMDQDVKKSRTSKPPRDMTDQQYQDFQKLQKLMDGAEL